MATGRIPTTANSPLTVKGDLFGYSTTQARVPVGNDGETLVADSSATTGLSYGANFAAGKNKIINGDFNINQRAFSSSTANGAYGFDRFQLVTQGTGGTTTYSAQTFTPGTAPVSGYEGSNFARLVTASFTGTNTLVQLDQKIEDVRTFAGQTITISFWAKAASGTPKIMPYMAQDFGIGGSPSSQTLFAPSAVKTISTSWARYSFNISVPSISGKTIGTTANTSYLSMRILVSCGSDFSAPYNTVTVQNNTFDIWGVQVEAGSTATAFQTATGNIQAELAACQRYYVRFSSTDVYHPYANGLTTSTSVGYINVPLPVEMRVAPYALDTSTITKLEIYNSVGSNKVLSALVIDRPSPKALPLVFTVSGAVNGQPVLLRNSNDATAFFGASAEL